MEGVTVRSESEPVPVPVAEEAPEPVAGPSSPLALLRGKRAELDRALFLDLAVPRWEHILGRRLWVRYRPGSAAVLSGATDKRQRAHNAAVAKGTPGDPDWPTKANADMLVAACEAVYDLDLDEDPPKGPLPPGAFPTFASPELSQALADESGNVPRSAVETALRLYGTTADLMVAANQLLAWSARESKEAAAAFLDD